MSDFNLYAPSTQFALEDIHQLLLQDSVSTRILEKNIQPVEGETVGVRLNLNLLKNTGVAIQTIHKNDGSNYQNNKGLFNGEVISYQEAVFLKDVFFNVNQLARENIASGKNNKYAMASVDGSFISNQIPQDFEGMDIKFNPKNQHLFVDENNDAVHYAEYVVVLGHRAFACGKIIYHTLESAPKKSGDTLSNTNVLSTPKEVLIDIPESLLGVRPTMHRKAF